MKRIYNIIIVAVLLSLYISEAFAQKWYFEYEPINYPLSPGILRDKDDWEFSKMISYKDYTVYLRKLHGFALYKDKVWTYYEPEIIKEKIINIKDVDSNHFDQMSFIDCITDNIGNLWLMAGNCILKFDGNNFYYYKTLKLKSGEIKDMFYNSHLILSNNRIMLRSLFKVEKERGYALINYIFEYNIQQNNFTESISRVSKLGPFTTYQLLIDSQDSIYLAANLRSDKEVQDTDPAVFLYGDKDTMIKIINYNLSISKYFNGKFEKIDSTVLKIDYQRRDSITDKNYYNYIPILNTRAVSHKNILYILANFCSTFYNTYPFSKVNSRIYKYNLATGEVNILIVPQIPNDTNIRMADAISVDTAGNIALAFRGVGTYFYSEKSGVEDDDDDDAFLVGARIWKIYPNPIKSKCRAEFHLSHSGKKDVKIVISDIQGKIYKDLTKDLQYNYKMREGTVDFTIDELPNGNYYFLIYSPNANDIQRILIMK